MAPAKSYLSAHYSLRNRIITALSQRFDNHTYTVSHGLIKGMKRKGGLGFLPAFLTRGSEDAPEFKFLSQLDLKGAVVYDVGAYQGILTLFFSRQARVVVAYEPNPPSRERLIENLQLNGVDNVIVRESALGAQEGPLTLIYDERMAGGASANPGVSAQIRQTSARVRSAQAEMIRLDEDIARAGLPPPQFIKLDVEGMELAVLEGMESTLAHHHPAILLEIHGATWEEKAQGVRSVLELLHRRDYQRILHVESGLPATPGDFSHVRSGHLYCTAHP